MNIIVVKPLPGDDWESNKETIKESGGRFIPELKCWVIEGEPDDVAGFASAHGDFEMENETNSLHDFPSALLIRAISRSAVL